MARFLIKWVWYLIFFGVVFFLVTEMGKDKTQDGQKVLIESDFYENIPLIAGKSVYNSLL